MGAAAAAIGVGGILGGVAGAQKDEVDQNSRSATDAGKATANEQAGQKGLMDNYGQLGSLVGAGAGQQDVTNYTNSSRSFADMLANYGKEGGANPTGGDISNANSLASQLFQAQRLGMHQNFTDQNVQANRQAAMMGRSMNDPVLAAKMGIEQTRQGAMLDANQGAFAAQYAQQQPMQRLGFAQQGVNVLGGLASQALANRQALASMGSGIMDSERNFRLQTAVHTGSQQQLSGGGLKGAITGMMGGMGAGASMASGMGGPSTPSYGSNPNVGQLSGMNYGQAPSQFFGGGYAQPQQSFAQATPFSNSGYSLGSGSRF